VSSPYLVSAVSRSQPTACSRSNSGNSFSKDFFSKDFNPVMFLSVIFGIDRPAMTTLSCQPDSRQCRARIAQNSCQKASPSIAQIVCRTLLGPCESLVDNSMAASFCGNYTPVARSLG
jgi:hypothetical protein